MIPRAVPVSPGDQSCVASGGGDRTRDLGPLHSGQTVAIVGGGPAGASCAIGLKRLAAEREIDLNVLLYETKNFESEQQYNQCAGLLSPPIAEVFRERLGVRFPDELVQREITDYLFHGSVETIRLSGGTEPSLAVRRVQFDRYLLREAVKRGVRIMRERVQDFETKPYGVYIFSESSSRLADAVVGAFGLDDGAARAFGRAVGYKPPPCIETLVTKIHPPEGQMARHGQSVYAFLPPIRKVEFAAIIPKGNHLTVVVAGNRLTTEAMDELLGWPPVREIVRLQDCQGQHLQYHKGRFPASLAKRIYGQRYVIVGDAAGLVRPFKGKGVTTACVTGHLAALTMMNFGIGKSAMRQFYAECHELVDDIFFGRIVRLLARIAQRSRAADELIRLARKDDGLRAAMYCCVSGDGAFRRMLAEAAGFGRAMRVGVSVVRGLLTRPQ